MIQLTCKQGNYFTCILHIFRGKNIASNFYQKGSVTYITHKNDNGNCENIKKYLPFIDQIVTATVGSNL